MDRLKELNIAREDFEDAVEIGLGCCGHWANIPAPNDVMSDFERLELGEVFKIIDIEDPETIYTLSIDGIYKALKIIKDEYPRYFKEIQEGNVDGISGDALIQIAACGDIVYD